MKRFALVMISLLALTTGAGAVAPPPMFATGSWSMGPTVGITYGSVSTDPSSEGWSWLMGLSGGVDARYYLCETSNLQFGMHYNQRGSKQSTSSSFYTQEITETRNYFGGELTAAWYFLEMCDGGFRPRIFGGLFAETFLSGRTKSVTSIAGGPAQTVEQDIEKSKVNSLNWGPKVGLGFDWKLGSGAITFSASYDYGLSNIDNAGSGTSYYNRGISAGLGYQFAF